MKKTKFFIEHQKLNAKMVEFAGYSMPVQYSGITEEHLAVRNSVGIFDVSHMGEVFVSGDNAEAFVQNLTTNDVKKLFNGKVQYSSMCYKNAGIIDDLLVYKIDSNKFMLVINASNIEKDFNWMQENNKYNVVLENKSEFYSLIAVQGPNSKKLLEKVVSLPFEMDYYTFRFDKIKNNNILISRTGYTGEHGYEIYFEGDESVASEIWNIIMDAGKEFDIKPCGLGARDTLRLEAGLCLYGNDIDETTNTLEAGLGWITKLSKGEFNGSEILKEVKEKGIERKLVGIVSDDKLIPRHGYKIYKDNIEIGFVTSGTKSPILNKSIAMGYVKSEFSVENTELEIEVRNKIIKGVVVKLPFLKK